MQPSLHISSFSPQASGVFERSGAGISEPEGTNVPVEESLSAFPIAVATAAPPARTAPEHAGLERHATTAGVAGPNNPKGSLYRVGRFPTYENLLIPPANPIGSSLANLSPSFVLRR